MNNKPQSSFPVRQSHRLAARNLSVEKSHRPGPQQIDERSSDLREYALDRTLAETFPCSDPLSSIPNPHAH